MDQQTKKILSKDSDGLLTYEYIANNIGLVDNDMDEIIDFLIDADQSGQFIVSAARFLSAIDSKNYARFIHILIAAAIDKDREHKYIAELLPAIWGNDYRDHIDELEKNDNNFRRIYKRLYPANHI